MLKGLLLAAASGTVANTGIFLQKVALDSRRPGDSIVSAFKTLPWLGGFAMLQVGWFAQLGALRFAPLYLVQPVVASGIIALVLLARARLHEPVDARLALSIATVILGAALLTAASAGTASSVPGDSAPVAAFAVPFAAACLLGGSSRWMRSMRAMGLALAAGILYGSAVALSKPVAGQLSTLDVDSLGRVLSHKELYFIGLASLAGLVFNQMALAAGRASVIAPVVLATMTVLPVGFGVAVFGESLPAYPARAAVWAGAAVSLFGVVSLARVEGAGSPLTPTGSPPCRTQGPGEYAVTRRSPTTS